MPVGTTDLLSGEEFTPDLAIANFGSKPAKVKVSLNAMSGDDPRVKIVADVIVAPTTVQRIELHDAVGDPAMRNSFIVDSDGQPGAVISNLILRGGQMFPAVALVGKDALDVDNAGGHPWSIANGDDSTLLLFNHAAVQRTFSLSVSAAGKNWQQAYSLAPNETRAIDLRRIALDQEADLQGKKLPVGAQSGVVSWFTGTPGMGTGRLLVSNPAAGLARNFSCGYYVVLCGGGMEYATATFAVGGTGTLGPLYGSMCAATRTNTCSGQSISPQGSNLTYNWTSSNNSVAELSGSGTNASATFSGKGAGTAQANGQISLASCSFTYTGTNNVCGRPNGESTAFAQWGDSDPLAGDDPAAAGFTQTLTPNTPAYAGGTVSESEASPSTDSCYFNGSAYPPIGGVRGSSWQVGSDSRWGPDYVGWVYAEFSYYQRIRPQMNLALPCNGTLFQQLTLKCSQGTSYVYDGPIVLQSTISGTGITDSREGQTVARQLIGH